MPEYITAFSSKKLDTIVFLAMENKFNKLGSTYYFVPIVEKDIGDFHLDTINGAGYIFLKMIKM